MASENRAPRVCTGRLQTGVLTAAALLVPLVFHPLSPEPFLFYKTWLLACFGLLAAAIGLATDWLSPAAWRNWPEGWLLAALVLWAGLSSIWAGNAFFTWQEMPHLAAPAALCIGARLSLSSEKRRRAVCLCIVLAGAIVSAVAVAEVLGRPLFFRESGKILALFGYQNLIAQHLMITLGFTVGLLVALGETPRQSRGLRVMGGNVGRAILLAALAVQLIVLVLTMCRSAWLGLLVGWAVVSVCMFRRGPAWRARLARWWPAAAAGVVVVAATFTLVGTWGAASLSYGTEALDVRFWGLISRGASGRWPIWESTCAMIADRPVLGVGFGNFPMQYPAYCDDNIEFVRYAHNDYLQWTAELGIPGLLLLLSILVLSIRRGRRLLKRSDARESGLMMALAAGIVGVTVESIFSYDYYQPVPAMYVFLAIGMLAAPDEDAAQRMPIPTISPVGLVLGLALMGTGTIFLWKSWNAKAAADAAMQARVDGDVGTALEHLQRWQMHAPKDPRPYFFEGVMSYETRQSPRAAAALQKAAALSPHVWQVHHYLAMLAMRDGRLEEAPTHLDRALALRRTSRELLITKELLRQRLAEPQK